MINEVGINDKCGGYLRLILLIPPTLLLVPPGGTSVFHCWLQHRVLNQNLKQIGTSWGISTDDR